MIYTPVHLTDYLNGAIAAAARPVDRHGVMVYMNADPDFAGPDFVIDRRDKEGIAIFREFAAKMAAHYKILKG
jgi:hypothetical protein